MFKLLVFCALVAAASASAISPYSYNYINPSVNYAPYSPYVSYSSYLPHASSYASTYKVYPAPITKIIAPAVTRIPYATPAINYPIPIGYSYGHSSLYNHGYGSGYDGYGYGKLGYGYGKLGYGYGNVYGHGY